MFEIRPASKSDCQPMLDLYTPIIEHTATSFEYQVPSAEQFQARISNIQQQYPWLVCTKDSQVAGYAYAGPHRGRKAYQWSTELSVYINPKFHRRGIARALYTALVDILKLQGYYTALAGISLPNEASVTFHETFGFTPVGIYQNIGYKFGVWHSVGWWEYTIQPYLGAVKEPSTVNHIIKSTEWQKILDTAENMIKTKGAQ